MQETTVFTYRISLSPTEWNHASEARHAAGDLWTRLVNMHRFCRRRHWPWPTETRLKAHFKRRLPLHSQTVQALIEKFCATIDGVRTKRQHGDKTARYPFRGRRYFNPIFKGQSLKLQGHHLLLPRGRGRDPIRVHVPALPTGRMVQAELGYGEIYLTLTRQLLDPVPAPSGKAGGLDIGVIHLGMVSDGTAALAISGRGLRSVKQGRAKAQARLRKKQSRTKPGSRADDAPASTAPDTGPAKKSNGSRAMRCIMRPTRLSRFVSRTALPAYTPGILVPSITRNDTAGPGGPTKKSAR